MCIRDRDLADEWRESLLESVAEMDEELMMKFLEGEEITEAEIKKVIRKATIAGEMIPMTCGSAYRNKGVQMMLDAVLDYMPSPLDIPPIKGIVPGTEEEEERPADDNGPFSALAFKIMADPFVGKLAFFRVYSGTLESGSYVYNSTKGKKAVSYTHLQRGCCRSHRCCGNRIRCYKIGNDLPQQNRCMC